MKILQCAMLAAAAGWAAMAGAQAPAQDPGSQAATRSATAYEPYLPPALRKPLRDAGASATLLRYQPSPKLKKRFEAADLDGNGALSREEARMAGFTVVDKNFDHIDTARRGNVSFDDLQTYLMQRREEASSR
ncbi:EF-hand domain-containing protein [Duganella sp. FT50W]|uniref:EF-hand domain-containing protein n=1 Tax=Duganella lactea TaxID=2692173 RepID=A0A6L8MM47_9BURK|nr:EF-hand domain-containing protein [Duganella lactea]MYM33129.1 EF-hand domain-containing protein [Duganella lactea]MYM80388.1 EF-hand domain-containing protein [Duganella lactea]